MWGLLRHRLLHASQLELEIIDAEALVRHHASDAILRESLRLDAQLAEEGENGRGHTAIALELNDDGIVHHAVGARLVVMELQSEVDGQTLRLAEIHQGDASETVSHGRHDVAPRQPGGFSEEVFARPLLQHGFERCHLRAPLCRLAMIVLAFYLKKRQSAAHIGSHAHLRPGAVAGLMAGKHPMTGGIVEICGGIRAEHLAIHTLRIVMPPAAGKQHLQRGEVGHKLHVRPFHQADGLHFVECDGRQFFQQLAYALQVCHVRALLRS